MVFLMQTGLNFWGIVLLSVLSMDGRMGISIAARRGPVCNRILLNERNENLKRQPAITNSTILCNVTKD